MAKLNAEKGLDVVVIDYLEKIAPSQRQMRSRDKCIHAGSGQRRAIEKLRRINRNTVLMVAQTKQVGKDTNSRT